MGGRDTGREEKLRVQGEKGRTARTAICNTTGPGGDGGEGRNLGKSGGNGVLRKGRVREGRK